MIIHPIPPVYDTQSRVLILGSFPSVNSREAAFFYGQPQNRFWRVLSAVCADMLPQSHEAKKAFLLRHRIALWDVLASCEITGSSDSSIKKAIPNDLSIILNSAHIKAIYCNGATSFRHYELLSKEATGREAVKLPSTSPANASFSLEKLISKWKVIKEDL